MTVYEFLDVFYDDGFDVEIYDTNADKVVFKDTAYEVKYSDYADYEIGSVDVPSGDSICINIELEADDDC